MNKQEYKAKDWVEIEYDKGYKYHRKVIQSGCSIVVSFDGSELYFDINGNEICKGENEPAFCITRKLKPSEVVLDFGNGIKGTIRRACHHVDYPMLMVAVVECLCVFGSWIASFNIDALTEPMKSQVKELLVDIEREEGVK